MRRKIEKQLLAWKNSRSRNLLLVYGARQVGKTYVLQSFGAKNYAKVVYVNLELEKMWFRFFKAA